MKNFFQSPGVWYNFLSFIFGIGGLALGTWALWLAYVQLGKTLNAAKAAKLAAESTAAQLGRLSTVIDLERLSALCREALALIGAEQYTQATRPLHDLRMGLAQLSVSTAGKPVGMDVEWEAIIATVAFVGRQINESKMQNPTEHAASEWREIISKVEEKLHTLKPKAAILKPEGV